MSRLLTTFAATLLLLVPASRAADKPVSYYNEIVPIFKKSCNGCHHPGKMKGQLDLTTYEAIKKGGKHGTTFVAGDPAKSQIVEEISGAEPSMPKEGDPLTKAEVALVERWITEGGSNDTPKDKANPYKLDAPPTYQVPAVISALTFSPDGTYLAVSGYHEVLLHKSDGSGLAGRLVGEAPRIESIQFSSDSKTLVVCGGAPAVFGEIQLWDVSTQKQRKSYKITSDDLGALSLSSDATKAAFTCAADKSVRMIDLADGKELLKFDNHSDWIFGTTFTLDGKRLLSGSRDRAMKLINLANGQFIDDINKLLEGVLCLSRHPKQDMVVYGGDAGVSRIYRIAENQGRTAANNDVNMVREFERQPGPVRSISYSPDGSLVAIGSVGEVRVYKADDGKRTLTLKGHDGAIFCISFHPSKPIIATGGYDGKVRLFDSTKGELVQAFIPFPIKTPSQVARGEEPARQN